MTHFITLFTFFLTLLAHPPLICLREAACIIPLAESTEDFPDLEERWVVDGTLLITQKNEERGSARYSLFTPRTRLKKLVEGELHYDQKHSIFQTSSETIALIPSLSRCALSKKGILAVTWYTMSPSKSEIEPVLCIENIYQERAVVISGKAISVFWSKDSTLLACLVQQEKKTRAYVCAISSSLVPAPLKKINERIQHSTYLSLNHSGLLLAALYAKNKVCPHIAIFNTRSEERLISLGNSEAIPLNAFTSCALFSPISDYLLIRTTHNSKPALFLWDVGKDYEAISCCPTTEISLKKYGDASY